MNKSVPRVAFLGVCDIAKRVQNVVPNLTCLNILGIRSEVIGRIYPLPIKSLHLVFSIYDVLSFDGAEIAFVSNKRGELYTMSISIDQRSFNAWSNHQPHPVPESLDETVVSDDAWAIFIYQIPDNFPAIAMPDDVKVILQYRNERIQIGNISFLYVPTPPLTEERIEAIRSDPRAMKFAHYEFTCTECHSKLMTYTGIERSTQSEEEGRIWYQELPENFICKCGKFNIDLKMLRESLHCVLGDRILAHGDEISLTRLYTKSALESIHDRFDKLIEQDTNEQEVQTFFEQNPVLFHRFSPSKIIPKAPILNKYQTDFAILSKTDELFLIEIERPNLRILKKDGGRTADFNHAFDQINDWLDVIRNHRQTCLEMMNLDNGYVAAIKGVVIIGRDSDYKRQDIRKLKSTDFGAVQFFTYDDWSRGFAALIRDIRDL